MRLKYTQILYYILYVAVALGFIIGVSYVQMFIFSLLIISLTIVIIGSKHRLYIPNYLKISIILSVIFIVLSNFFTEYSQFYTLRNLLMLVWFLILLENGYFFEKIFQHKKFDWFYVIMIITLIYNIIISFNSYQSIIVFNKIGDKNYTGVLIYMFFMYSLKQKRFLGMLLGVFFALLLTDSRSYIAMIMLTIVLYVINEMILQRKTHIGKENKHITVIAIFIGVIIVSIVLSYIWVYVISANGYTAYKLSLNDESNRMRFVSNIKALSLLNKPQETLLWGYGDDLVKALGISSNSLSTFMGIRLVQTHNTFFNILLRMGIFPGFIYLFLLSKFLDKFYKYENLAYIIPYILNSIFMHSLFSDAWLLFWIAILVSPKRNVSKKLRFNLRQK